MKHVLILGSPRSGTSLLTWLLGSQDHIALSSEVKRKAWYRVVGHDVVGVKLCIPEQILLYRQSRIARFFGRIEKNVFRPLHRAFGPPFHRPHVPGEMAITDFMQFDSPFAIAVLRDPHEVINSIMRRWGQPKWAAYRIYRYAVDTIYETWSRYPGQVFLVDFDTLVVKPEEVVERICSWIGIEFDQERVSGYTKNYGRNDIDRGKQGGRSLDARVNHPVFERYPDLAERYREMIENGVCVTAGSG